jgi:hypothetical protein
MAAWRSPKPQTWVRFLLLLPRRVSQVGRRLSARQLKRRFDSDPRFHGGQHRCAGGPYKPEIALDRGVRQSSILWAPTKVYASVVQKIGHHATNVEIGIRVLAGVPFGRVRPSGPATSLLSWRYVSSNLTAPSMPGSSNGKMCARLAQHRGSSPRPGTTPG